MFFVARCLLWILLVYAALPGTGGTTGAAAGWLLDLASAHLEGYARRTVAAAALTPATSATKTAETGSEWCKAHGEACVEAVLAAMAAKDIGVGRAAPVDTLGAADKAMRWLSSRSRG